MTQQHNKWVDHLLSLYQHSFIGNKENRSLASNFARHIYIETRLDTELLKDLCTQVEEVPDLYSLKIRLHTQGLGLKRKGAKVIIEQVWKKAPLIQIPLGIGHNPNRERRDGKITKETRCTDTEKNTYEIAISNENLKQLIKNEAEKAKKDGRLRRIITFDTPQAVSNYLHFTSTPNLRLCPHDYIQNQATHYGRTINRRRSSSGCYSYRKDRKI